MSSLARMIRPGEFKVGNWIGIIVLALIGIAVGGFFAVRSVYRSYELSPFQSSLPDYLAARPSGGPMDQMCKGGIMPIDSSTNTIDSLFFDLPANLKPANPAAVNTIVFVRWERVQTHTYSNGAAGYTNSCHIEVVDRETKMFLKQAHFTGQPPPQTIRGRSGSGEGPRPTEQVIAFLRNNQER